MVRERGRDGESEEKERGRDREKSEKKVQDTKNNTKKYKNKEV